MTTERHEVFRCALCSEESEHTIIGSMNAVGHPDLDARPPQMRRSTLFAWVQRCLTCGYCATDISSPCVTAPSVVASDAYNRSHFSRPYKEAKDKLESSFEEYFFSLFYSQLAK